MSLTLKLSSLAIRTLSKPIANQIKAQAREHERFRHVCVSMAQALHRFDMRLRLGSIRDTSASKRQAEAEAAVKKHTPTSPTAKTEAESKAEDAANAKAKAAAEDAAKPRHYRIRPLSESKAIESGANFISESFLFLVAGGLIVFESWRSRRKESTRRETVEGRLSELEQSEKTAVESLVALEKELLALKAKQGEATKSTPRILPRKVWENEPRVELEEAEESWWSRITSYFPRLSQTTTSSTPAPQPAQNTTSESSSGPRIGQETPPVSTTTPADPKQS
ncbi:hypothetical protein N7492_001407 [Penicillium capsulatum]|uniref:OPA3 domain protein n=1 Tax=Penicillium capsulatum TaxID=69766 RepID=A0A9W9LZD6_9EURO|nr:hypothetical protein N7492_001407 [Penicillium capsulatum]KAJ6129537.1 hypothetical protein N7512_002317 [Penicillium capsulatum]